MPTRRQSNLKVLPLALEVTVKDFVDPSPRFPIRCCTASRHATVGDVLGHWKRSMQLTSHFRTCLVTNSEHNLVEIASVPFLIDMKTKIVDLFKYCPARHGSLHLKLTWHTLPSALKAADTHRNLLGDIRGSARYLAIDADAVGLHSSTKFKRSLFTICSLFVFSVPYLESSIEKQANKKRLQARIRIGICHSGQRDID